MITSTLTSITDFLKMSDTVNVLPYLKELKETWRNQDFRFTKDQQIQYDMLIQARRERVKYFYDNDMVAKPGMKRKEEEED